MRLRITFSKQGALRYTGQLDLHRIWERTARRAGLPLAYSQGFHPQPKIQLAAALPLGFSSRCEVVDLRFNSQIPLQGLAERLQASVPSGLKILSIQQIDERAPALQSQIDSAEYEVVLLRPLDLDVLIGHLGALLETSSLPRERRGRRYDLRPLIEQLSVAHYISAGEGVASAAAVLHMRLACREAATGRPDEVLDELGIPIEDTRIERVGLIMKNHVAT